MNLKIAVLSGDGIGPEVTEQAVKVLKPLRSTLITILNLPLRPWVPSLLTSVGDPLPESTLDICKANDSILFGAIGHPKYDNDPTAKVRPEQGTSKTS